MYGRQRLRDSACARGKVRAGTAGTESLDVGFVPERQFDLHAWFDGRAGLRIL